MNCRRCTYLGAYPNLSVYQSIIDMENSRVVIYARVSSTTDRQSTERQVSDLRMLAESRKYTRRKYQEEEGRPLGRKNPDLCFKHEVSKIYNKIYNKGIDMEARQRKIQKEQFLQSVLNTVSPRV